MMKRRKGQAALEYILTLGVLLPFTLGLVSVCQLMWVYHTAVEFTRMGARYGASHCWQSDGGNVRAYLRQNTPPVLDADILFNGPAEVQIIYFKRDPATGLNQEFACDTECSTACVPDLITVRVRNYEFRRFLSYLGVPPVRMPEFFATMPMESAGCDPETGTCNP